MTLAQLPHICTNEITGELELVLVVYLLLFLIGLSALNRSSLSPGFLQMGGCIMCISSLSRLMIVVLLAFLRLSNLYLSVLTSTSS